MVQWHLLLCSESARLYWRIVPRRGRAERAPGLPWAATDLPALQNATEGGMVSASVPKLVQKIAMIINARLVVWGSALPSMNSAPCLMTHTGWDH